MKIEYKKVDAKNNNNNKYFSPYLVHKCFCAKFTTQTFRVYL